MHTQKQRKKRREEGEKWDAPVCEDAIMGVAYMLTRLGPDKTALGDTIMMLRLNHILPPYQ